MQDTKTGKMHEIDKLLFEEELRKHNQGDQNLKPVFQVGELLTIRGGKFRIVALGTDGMRLRGVPADTTD